MKGLPELNKIYRPEEMRNLFGGKNEKNFDDNIDDIDPTEDQYVKKVAQAWESGEDPTALRELTPEEKTKKLEKEDTQKDPEILTKRQQIETFKKQIYNKMDLIRRSSSHINIIDDEKTLQYILQLERTQQWDSALLYTQFLIKKLDKIVLPSEKNIQKNKELIQEEINTKVSKVKEILGNKKGGEFTQAQTEHITSLLQQMHRYWQNNNVAEAYDFADRAYNTALSAERINLEIQARSIKSRQSVQPPEKKGFFSQIGSAVRSIFGSKKRQ